MLPELGQVYLPNFLATEVDVEDAIDIGRSHRNFMTDEPFSDVPLVLLYQDVTVSSNFQDPVFRKVLDWGQNFRELPSTAAVAVHRGGIIQGAMRANVIVDFAPVIKSSLAVGNGLEASTANDFEF